MQAEQPPGSAAAPNGANNWLNVGSTDSGFYGGGNPAWNNPITAANTTAAWLRGNNIYGYKGAAKSVQAILQTAGQSPGDQIAAIQQSGWASSGYPNLPTIYSNLTGSVPTSTDAAATYGGTRPGGQPANPDGTPIDTGQGVVNLLTEYQDELDTPRTAPSSGFVSLGQAGWKAPFQWWWQSFSSNWQNENG